MGSTSVEARVRRLLTTVFLLVSAASAVEAQEAVPVYEIDAGSLSIDGSLEDWRRLSIPPSMTEQDLIFWPQPPGRKSHWLLNPPEGAPIDFEVRLAWSAEPSRIFAAFDIVDDDFLEGSSWTSSDLVGIGVDGDNRDGQFTRHYTWGWGGGCDDLDSVIERQAWKQCPELYNQRIAQYYWVFPDVDGFALLRNYDVSNHWERWDFDPWILEGSLTAAVGRVATGVSTPWTVEVMVTPFDDLDFRGPEHSTPSRLAEGQRIGLEILVVDVHPDGLRHLYLLGDPSYPDSYTDRFAEVLLVPADRQTSVETTKWGWLKRETAED